MTDSSATSAAAAPPPLDEAELATLRRGLVARYAPADSIEEHWIEELVFCAWRQKRLRRIEAAALTRLTAGDLEGPSLETLRRYGARIERDWRRAMVELRDVADRPSERGDRPLQMERRAASLAGRLCRASRAGQRPGARPGRARSGRARSGRGCAATADGAGRPASPGRPGRAGPCPSSAHRHERTRPPPDGRRDRPRPLGAESSRDRRAAPRRHVVLSPPRPCRARPGRMRRTA